MTEKIATWHFVDLGSGFRRQSLHVGDSTEGKLLWRACYEPFSPESSAAHDRLVFYAVRRFRREGWVLRAQYELPPD